MTVMVSSIELFDHKYVPPPVAVSSVFCPAQRFKSPEIAALGTGITVTVTVLGVPMVG